MSYYIIIRRPIINSFYSSSINTNPSQQALLNDLKSYPKVYLFNSLEDAKFATQFFFHELLHPRDNGGYGLIAEVTLASADLPEETEVDQAEIYNNWIDSQKLKYRKSEITEFIVRCIIVDPGMVQSILRTWVPEEARAYNRDLIDMDYTRAAATSTCQML